MKEFGKLFVNKMVKLIVGVIFLFFEKGVFDVYVLSEMYYVVGKIVILFNK